MGSTIGLVNASGTIATNYTYQPFRATTVGGAASGNTYHFTGRENDGTGFFYRERYYSPNFQRFISQDPRTTIGSLNPYAYVLNDPINLIDPLGLFPWPSGLPVNILLGGGGCGFAGGIIGAAAGGFITGGNPFGAIAGAAFLNEVGQAIWNDICAGALNCNEEKMLQPPSSPLSFPPSGSTCP